MIKDLITLYKAVNLLAMYSMYQDEFITAFGSAPSETKIRKSHLISPRIVTEIHHKSITLQIGEISSRRMLHFWIKP